MTTKRELERLARKALGDAATVRDYEGVDHFEAATASGMRYVSACAPNEKERREMLAAALRGIICWKEGKQ